MSAFTGFIIWLMLEANFICLFKMLARIQKKINCIIMGILHIKCLIRTIFMSNLN